MRKSRVFVGLVALAWSSPLVLAEEIETLPPLVARTAPSQPSAAPGPVVLIISPAATPTATSSVANFEESIAPPLPVTPTTNPPATLPATTQNAAQKFEPLATQVVSECRQAAPVCGQEVSACRPGTLIAGAAVYILRPYFGADPAFTTTTGLGGSSPHQSTTDFDWDYNATPAFWLGWLNPNGFGARGHYFYFDQRSSTGSASLTADQALSANIAPPANLASPAGSPSFGAPGVILGSGLGQDNLEFRSNLRIQAIDMELCQRINRNDVFALFSGGARYLHLSQDYQATLSNVLPPAAGASETQILQFGHNFNGAGPTLDIMAGCQIGSMPLYFFGDVRGSFLVGSSRSTRNFVLSVEDPNGVASGDAFANPTANDRRNTTLPIVELEAGLQFEPAVLGRPIYVRCGVVNQTYFGAGSASQTSGNLSLFGGQVSVGMLY